MRTSRMSLSKAALEAVDRGAQPLDLGGEVLELATAHERAAFRGGVIGQGLAHAAGRVELPACKRAYGAADTLRGHVAERARELLFSVPAQVLGEVAQLIGELARARNTIQRNDRFRLGSARLDAAAGADGQAQRGKERRPQLGRAPGEALEALARPALAIQQLVQQKAKGHRGGGLCRGEGVAQCICWMPARSQPLEPSAGLTRFHTSSKPTGSVPGVSRTMPEKRTLAQCWSRSVASSSRSAFSATTSVCWCAPWLSVRSSSYISRVVNSRMSSSRPESFATCSLMKFIFAARRKPAASKPAGTRASAATTAPL